ncbi:class D sortase [Bacillaceae bacterium SIJ1]|uniref:sortase n=1 Tax=Litoribacterium kuwaitense TaxID=1398745 RepID=UPI0013EA36DF|nr:sortase [Litoribacterium kuwaitense]NGP46564.1 class D sortase [Litoribacterium kuwaitense]
MKKLSNLLMVVGIAILAFVAYQVYEYKSISNNAMDEVRKVMAASPSQYTLERSNVVDDMYERIKLVSERYEVEHGAAFAYLKIPSIDLELPVASGTDNETLKKGVGHHTATWFPGEGNQVFFSGHNDSAFTSIGEVKEGDLLEVEMPYGTFQYEMKKSEIVMSDDTSIIGDMEEETLVLSTCYPFYALTDTPERYILYAELKDYKIKE